jgi:hypothetical protein
MQLCSDSLSPPTLRVESPKYLSRHVIHERMRLFYKAKAPSATRPMRPMKAEVRAAPPSEAVTCVASASEEPVDDDDERVEVDVVRPEVPLLWCVADDAAATTAAVVELESVLVAEDSVAMELAALELLVADADAEEDESLALGAALLVLSITKGGV